MGRLPLAVLLAAVMGCGAACTDSDRDRVATEVGPGKPVVNTAPPAPGDGRDVELTLREGGALDVLTWGSGSCPYVPVDVERLADDRVRVVLEQLRGRDGEACTDDLRPTVASVQLPDDVDDRGLLRIDLHGVGPERSLGVRLGFTTGGRVAVRTPEQQ